MMTTKPAQPCGCKNCADPDAEAAYANAKAAYEEQVAVNRRGFDLYVLDLEAGRPLMPAAFYAARAAAERAPQDDPA